MYSQPDGKQSKSVRNLLSQQTSYSINKRDVLNSKLQMQPLVRPKVDQQSLVEKCFQMSFQFSCKSYHEIVQIDQTMCKDLIPVSDALHSKHAGVFNSCPTSHSRTPMQKDHHLPLYVKPLPVFRFDPGSNDMQPFKAPTCPEVLPRPIPLTSKLCLNAIISTPVLDKGFESDVEYKLINLSGRLKKLVAVKVDSSGLSDYLNSNPNYPLELTYVDNDSDESSTKSEIDLDSTSLFDSDYSEVGTDPCVIFDELVNKQQSLIDLQREVEQEVVSCTKEIYPSQRIDQVNSESSSEVIDSTLSPKRVYSCCKNSRKSSWNGGSVQQHNARLKLVYNRRPRKIVVLGDMYTGKSALISAYCTDRFSDIYVPTILRSCQTDAEMENESIELVVIEVAGREDYFKLRKCVYRKTDAFILCYSLDNISSLEKVKSHWLPEIQAHASKTPFILVGTKKDNREAILDQIGRKSNKRNLQSSEDNHQSKIEKLVSTEQGYKMSQCIGAHCFLECSARYRDGTRHVFETVTKIAVKKSRRKRKVQKTGDVCSIM